jgi:hypothetical protein
MNEMDIQIHISRQKDMQHAANNERLVRSLNKQAAHNDSLRERLGRGLIHVGEQLLKR